MRNSEAKWMEWQNIIGFNYEEDYEYVIRVRKERVIFDEVDGPPIYQYTYLEEISKIKKDSENIPNQTAIFRIASKRTNDNHYPFWAQLTTYPNEPWIQIPALDGFEYEEDYECFVFLNCKFNGTATKDKYTYTYKSTHTKVKKDTEGLPNL